MISMSTPCHSINMTRIAYRKMFTILRVESLKFSGHPLLLLRKVLKLRPGFIILNELIALKIIYHTKSQPVQVSTVKLNALFFKIQPLGGVCYSGCKNCRSQDKRTPGVERVNRLRERVKRDFSDSQKNLEAIEYHFAYVANEPPFVQNFRYLCRILELSDAEVDQIEYDNPWPADDDIKDRVRVANEQAYQALYKWKKMRKHTTIGDLATALASTGDTAAVDNLLKALS